MSAEVMLVAGYAGFLLVAAVVLEWLSAHTHRRALRYRTAGFTFWRLTPASIYGTTPARLPA